MPHPLDSFFRPRSIAFIGATERSVWTRAALANLRTLGYEGKLHLVNRKGGEVLGQPAATSAASIGEPVDVALVMVPSEVLLSTFPDLEAAGIRNAVVLSSGFAESGKDGAARQQALSDAAREHGVSLLGPNCLGFVNFVDRTPVWTVGARPPVGASRIAIVSQSGALAAQMSYFAGWQGIGLTYMISTGNEAGIDVAQAIDYLADEPRTQAIAVFLESVRDPSSFERAALRAKRARKPIVVLKVGTSQVAMKAAQAHTGSLVGDDRVFDAACQRMGLIRVRSLEDLIITAEVAARTGPISGGLGVVSLSGGLCEIAADRAEAEGVELPGLEPATMAALENALPGFGTPHNPLDVTGAVMLQPELLERSLEVLYAASNLSAMASVLDVPSAPEDDSALLRKLVASVSAVQGRHAKPGVMFSHTMRPMSAMSQQIAREANLSYLPCGVHHGVTALGRVRAWTEMLDRPTRTRDQAVAQDVRPQSEQQTLEFLASRGVPVIPTQIARSADDAVAIAQRFGASVALKIASADIQHKSDIGGVILDVRGDAAVADAYRMILQNASRARPEARIDGVAIAPMRKGGVELFVGTMRDPQWGPVLAVGLGGVWVEALRDTSLRLLPVTASEAEEMLSELRGSKLLDGFRGAPAVDRKAVARVIAAIGEAALVLGPELLSLEVNPLRASGDEVEALDGLVEWGGQPAGRLAG
ncbi:acyl-CoA synthetase (NDP forming) [Povalibacter uvarum]|uniref:Acyl-CoA synthetase (NDP forming) n=1 Tax=Povalibacter uvarum TaxID=732238 RepID=A0A841HPY6_9GAMM|nr:acetate--CoA ligase family protein [Povalibacter uvarum]MBB6095401.1 acyl-CoA synthetase (NDP forming) [Povalibacter uvarum]